MKTKACIVVCAMVVAVGFANGVGRDTTAFVLPTEATVNTTEQAYSDVLMTKAMVDATEQAHPEVLTTGTTVNATENPDEDVLTFNATLNATQNVSILDNKTSSTFYGFSGSYDTYVDVYYIFIRYMTVICAFALLTNTLSIIVFLRRGKTVRTVDMLLIALAVSDTLALMNFMDLSINYWTGWSLQQNTGVGCKLIQYITNAARDWSSHLILIFTVDRFLAVWFPLKQSSLVTKKRVRLAIAGAVLWGLALEVYVLFLNKYYELVNICSIADDQLNAKLVTYLRNVLGFIVPGSAVAVFNTLIVVRMRKYQTTREAMTTGDGNGKGSGPDRHQNRSLTFMLVTVSTFSFLVATPKTGLFIYLSNTSSFGWDKAMYSLIMDMILVLNYFCNFFFYCITGSEFRKDLLRIVFRRGPNVKMNAQTKTTRDAISRRGASPAIGTTSSTQFKANAQFAENASNNATPSSEVKMEA